MILFEDEASFAQWGSLSYTWARRGHQPEVPTSGKRKGYKVFGAIEYLWKKTKQRATHNKYFQEFLALTVAVDKALAYFAMHPDTVLGLFGRYCEESGLELKQAA